MAFAVGKAIRYFRQGNKLVNSRTNLLKRYNLEQEQTRRHYSTTSDFDTNTMNNSSTTSSTSSNTSTTSTKEDPMAKYELVAPELGVGYDRWCAIRKAWQTGCKDASTSSLSDKKLTRKKNYDKYVDVDSIVEHIVNPRKPAFKHPVPLPEMIVILIELWEADGLYD